MVRMDGWVQMDGPVWIDKWMGGWMGGCGVYSNYIQMHGYTRIYEFIHSFRHPSMHTSTRCSTVRSFPGVSEVPMCENTRLLHFPALGGSEYGILMRAHFSMQDCRTRHPKVAHTPKRIYKE